VTCVNSRREHHHQGLDLILVSCCLIRELRVQTDQFAVGSYLLTGNIASACLSGYRKVRAMVMASSRSVLARKPRCW